MMLRASPVARSDDERFSLDEVCDEDGSADESTGERMIARTAYDETAHEEHRSHILGAELEPAIFNRNTLTKMYKIQVHTGSSDASTAHQTLLAAKPMQQVRRAC